MNRLLKILILVLTLFQIEIQAQSLDDYLKEAAENNQGLKATFIEFETAMQRIQQVKALPDPTLSFGYFISPIETRVGPQKAKISLSQMFPWFGTLAAREDVATHSAEARYHEFLDVKNKLYFDVKAAYYPLYEVHELIRWQQRNLDILNTYKILLTTAFSNGRGTMVDIIRVDITIENTKTDIQLLKDQIKPLEVVFHKLLNRTDSSHVVITDSLVTISIDSDYRKDSLLAHNPKLRAIDMEIQAAVAREEVAKKVGLPNFGIGIDYAIVGKRSDMTIPDNGKDAFMPLVTMSLPIFRGKYKASVKEAQLIQTALSYRKKDMENTLLSSYETAWYELEKSRQLNELYSQQIISTQQAINLLFIAYSNSGKEFEEVLRMQQQLLKYEIAKVGTVKNFHTALAKLDYITTKSE